VPIEFEKHGQTFRGDVNLRESRQAVIPDTGGVAAELRRHLLARRSNRLNRSVVK
jgi:hypothetical protein